MADQKNVELFPDYFDSLPDLTVIETDKLYMCAR